MIKARNVIRRIGSFLLGGGITLLMMTPLLCLLNSGWVVFTLSTGTAMSLSGWLLGGLEYR